ncbi:MAG: HlyC/CorC family transporter [Phycisphaerae bacterium]|nr:HlyC/CorC family transporter [Phycisphaerae bacterium]
MGSWLIWLAVGQLLVVLLSTVVNLALRLPSRARLAEKMELQGRKEELNHLLELRVQFLLATAVLRAMALLSFVLVVVESLRRDTDGISFGTYLWAFVLALAGVLVFGIAIPSAWAKYAGESLLIVSLPVLRVLRCVLYPLVVPLLALDWLVRRLAGVRDEGKDITADHLEQEILKVVSEGEAHGVVDEEEKEMIESIIEFRDTQVDQIMTPRTDINAMPRDVTFEELKELIREKGHSRVPLYEETVDNIVGIIYAKDLLQVANPEPFDAGAIMREPIYIPESKQLRDLLHEFQEGKGHMAIVLDEYGGTAGLVTIEDILEELVGEIVDEYEDQDQEPLRRIDDSTVEVDARMRIDELNDELDIDLPESEDYETIGGFVFSALGKIPQSGAECAHDNIKICVTDAGPRKINRLRLQITRDSLESNGTAR